MVEPELRMEVQCLDCLRLNSTLLPYGLQASGRSFSLFAPSFSLLFNEVFKHPLIVAA